MFKYLLLTILILNQLLAINSILIRDKPLVLCLCEYGKKVTLENEDCSCQGKLEQSETSAIGSIIIKNLCFELPITAGHVTTKCIGSFDAKLYLKSIAFPNKKAKFYYFLSSLESFKSLDGLIYRANGSMINGKRTSSSLSLLSQPLAILRC